MTSDAASEPSEFEYFKNKRADRTYISSPFEQYDLPQPQLKQARIISKVFDSEWLSEFVKIDGEIVLRVTPGGRQEVKAVFYDDTRSIRTVVFQRFWSKDGNPTKISFSLSGNEIEKLFNVLKCISYLDLPEGNKVRLDDQVFNEWLTTEEEKKRYLEANSDLVAQIVTNQITKTDLVAVAYRKKQLEIFQGLIEDDKFFEAKMKEWDASGKEATWQRFLKTIHGYLAMV